MIGSIVPRASDRSLRGRWMVASALFCVLSCGARSEVDTPPELVRPEDRMKFVGDWTATVSETLSVTLDCQQDPRWTGPAWRQPAPGAVPVHAFIRLAADGSSLLVVNQNFEVASFDTFGARQHPARFTSRTRAEFDPVWLGNGITWVGGLRGTTIGSLRLEGDELVVEACWLEYRPGGPSTQEFGFKGVARYRRR